MKALRRVRRRGSSGVFWAVCIGWLLVVGGPPLLLSRARSAWLEALDVPSNQEAWEQFRADMRRQSGRQGPVQRKVPKSPEPPLRVWLRDYFWLALAAWSVLGTALYGFCGFLVVGMSRQRHSAASFPQNQPGGDRNAQKQDQGDAKHSKH